MAEREEIEDRFRANLGRVGDLVVLYESIVSGSRGRKPTQVSDILCAAVVLLHASLEDLLRSLAEWKLPQAPASSLERVPLAGPGAAKDRFTLVDLAGFRGQTVDAVIAKSVEGFLERSSYNHPGEVIELLGKIGVKATLDRVLKTKLANMMARRHWIAHRADRNPRTGPGHQMTRSISAAEVRIWLKAVETTGGLIFGEL